MIELDVENHDSWLCNKCLYIRDVEEVGERPGLCPECNNELEAYFTMKGEGEDPCTKKPRS